MNNKTKLRQRTAKHFRKCKNLRKPVRIVGFSRDKRVDRLARTGTFIKAALRVLPDIGAFTKRLRGIIEASGAHNLLVAMDNQYRGVVSYMPVMKPEYEYPDVCPERPGKHYIASPHK